MELGITPAGALCNAECFAVCHLGKLPAQPVPVPVQSTGWTAASRRGREAQAAGLRHAGPEDSAVTYMPPAFHNAVGLHGQDLPEEFDVAFHSRVNLQYLSHHSHVGVRPAT